MDTPNGTEEWTEGRFLAFFADAKACAATDTLDDLARELRCLWDAGHSYGVDDGWKTLSDYPTK